MLFLPGCVSLENPLAKRATRHAKKDLPLAQHLRVRWSSVQVRPPSQKWVVSFTFHSKQPTTIQTEYYLFVNECTNNNHCCSFIRYMTEYCICPCNMNTYFIIASQGCPVISGESPPFCVGLVGLREALVVSQWVPFQPQPSYFIFHSIRLRFPSPKKYVVPAPTIQMSLSEFLNFKLLIYSFAKQTSSPGRCLFASLTQADLLASHGKPGPGWHPSAPARLPARLAARCGVLRGDWCGRRTSTPRWRSSAVCGCKARDESGNGLQPSKKPVGRTDGETVGFAFWFWVRLASVHFGSWIKRCCFFFFCCC